ncbi:MAG: Na/Pi cotransporter family protein [Patescibacteria group bacterium]
MFMLVGGLALFLYGIYLLSEGFQKLAGDRLKKILERFTNRPIKGVVSGAAVTSIVQSSSITTVILLSLVNAGMIKITSAAGVIMGANIGTTITAQILAFKLESLALLFVALGIALWFINKGPNVRYWGNVLLGLGLLFLGMSFMKDGVSPLRQSEFFMNMLTSFSQTPILGVLAGALFTGLIQSSSASIGLTIALAKSGMISLGAALPIILGAEIGTTVTALLASIPLSKNAKRVAIIHTMFNVLGTTIFLLIFPFFQKIVELTASSIPRQIANAHTIFNITNTLLLFALIPILVKIAKMIFKGEEKNVNQDVKFIDRGLLKTPSLALDSASKELNRMGNFTLSMLEEAYHIFSHGKVELIKIVKKKEDSVDKLFRSINHYLVELSTYTLTDKESHQLAGLSHTVNDVERVGDHINNLAELAQYKANHNIIFSEEAYAELTEFFDKVIEINQVAVRCFEKNDKYKAREILHREGAIDNLEEIFSKNHNNRIQSGKDQPITGGLFSDVLRNLERISDHAANVAHMVLKGF